MPAQEVTDRLIEQFELDLDTIQCVLLLLRQLDKNCCD
jgi:hypothetical protein